MTSPLSDNAIASGVGLFSGLGFLAETGITPGRVVAAFILAIFTGAGCKLGGMAIHALIEKVRAWRAKAK